MCKREYEFGKVDKPFYEWALENSHHVCTEAKGYEVRSVNIYDKSGSK